MRKDIANNGGVCPRCGTTATKNGTHLHPDARYQKYHCASCGHHFEGKYESAGCVISGDGTDLVGQARTLDDLLKKANVDLGIWEVESYEIKDNSYEVSAKEREQDLRWTKEYDKKGNPLQIMEGTATHGDWQTKQNKTFYIKVKLRRRKNTFDTEAFRAELIESVKKHSPIVPPKKYKKEGAHCMEINIFDLHLGKLAWAPETGDNYDNKIAQDRFFSAVRYFITIASMFDIDEILFPFGNDFFNSDSDYPYPMTTAGTPQENDLRWQKSFKTGREMIIRAVDMLSDVAPVKLVAVPGNHDYQKIFYLGDVLDVRYENNENVIVDNLPRSRKYYKYGKNLIGLTHGRGSDVPESRLLLLMPQEVPQLWAETKYREWHCGDIHHKKKVTVKDEEDHHGITIRYMRSLKGTDSWEYQKGYVGSLGGAEAFIWHRENGLIATFNYNL